MAKEEISHSGRIVEIDPQYTSVEIISESACSSCHAAALCGISEYTKKAIQVPTRGWDDYKVGDEVEVLLQASMGHKAVWLAYVLPLLVLVAALLLSLEAGASELLAGAVSVLAAALYYIILWLMRDRLRSEYVFTIRKNQN